jgi:hypothetical protein
MSESSNQPETRAADEHCADVVAKLSEFQTAMRAAATSIDAHVYMKLSNKLRDLEEAITGLRRAL